MKCLTVGLAAASRHRHLDSTRLLYYHARHYDPAIGRFVSADMIIPGFGGGVHMKSQVEYLLDKYRPLGIVTAGELLVRPEEALRLADELEAIGVPIIGVDIWYYVGGNLAEDPAGLDLSDRTAGDSAVLATVAAAKQYIRHHLPPHVALVSFVIEDQNWWKTVVE